MWKKRIRTVIREIVVRGRQDRSQIAAFKRFFLSFSFFLLRQPYTKTVRRRRSSADNRFAAMGIYLFLLVLFSHACRSARHTRNTAAFTAVFQRTWNPAERTAEFDRFRVYKIVVGNLTEFFPRLEYIRCLWMRIRTKQSDADPETSDEFSVYYNNNNILCYEFHCSARTFLTRFARNRFLDTGINARPYRQTGWAACVCSSKQKKKYYKRATRYLILRVRRNFSYFTIRDAENRKKKIFEFCIPANIAITTSLASWLYTTTVLSVSTARPPSDQ